MICTVINQTFNLKANVNFLVEHLALKWSLFLVCWHRSTFPNQLRILISLRNNENIINLHEDLILNTLVLLSCCKQWKIKHLGGKPQDSLNVT